MTALKEENEQLKLELAEMEAAIRQAEYDREENARLRELLGLREQRRDLVFESALIVEEDYSNWSSIVTVNKGTAMACPWATVPSPKPAMWWAW